jgi:hypothetical protein
MGGNDFDWGRGIAADACGNVVIIGDFASTGLVDFDPNGGGDFHRTNGGRDVFVTKLGPDGSYQWTRTFGSPGPDQGFAIATDPGLGVFITGSFSGTVDFNPGPGDVHVSHGDQDVFITSYDGNGGYLWTHTLGGPQIDEGHGIEIDSNGNVLLTGVFMGRVNFSPAPGEDFHTSTPGFDYRDIFLTKYAPDGSYGWTQTFGGPDHDEGLAVKSDAQANVFLAGRFRGTVDFKPGGGDVHTANGYNGLFITKLTADGSYGWTRTVDGPPYEQVGLALTPDGDVLTTGGFFGTVDFDPDGGGVIRTAHSGGSDIFVLDLTPP